MRRTEKVLSVLLSLTMLCSIFVPTAFAADSRYYNDTADHWAEAAIEKWSSYGIIEGNGVSFDPDNAITRAQMATILSKTLGLTETAENPFSDVLADSWYAPYVLRCYTAGIMLGSDGRANPDSEITRQEAMTMFCRAFDIKADETADLTAFKDSGSIDAWALPYVSALINSGIVSGVSNDMLAPAENMSRASLVTILDRAVVQYINASGEYELIDKDGIILVAAGETALKGETKADILITQAASGKAVTFKDATITGEITVKADTKIINDNSNLPEIANVTVENVAKVEDKKPTTKPSGGSGGGYGGSSGPVISNLTVSEEKTVSGGTYNNVTITDAVGDGEISLENVTINGNLTINGGGSSSIKLNGCSVAGAVVIAKEGGAAPRLELTKTPITAVKVQQPAIIEAVDAISAVSTVEATANIEIKGESTKISTVTIPETAKSAVTVTVTAGNVATVEAKAETTVAGAADSVNTIVATAAVTADSQAVQKVEIPETAAESVSVTVEGDDAVDIEINSANGVSVMGTNVTVSTTLETAPENITVGGETVTHIHKWGEPETLFDATCEQDGKKLYTCIAEGCTEPAETKKETIPALGHNYGEWKFSDNDLHVRECANDKEHYEKDDHTWDEGKVTTEPTCGNEGIKTYTCSVCKGTKTEEIDEIAHDWGEWEKVDANTHKRVCKTDSTHIEIEDHTPIADAGTDATCTETGLTEGSHCDICKSVIVEQETIPALNHDFTGEYQKDADGHWHICQRDNCEDTDTKAVHTYNTKNCAEEATCTACGYIKEAGEHTWSKWEKVDEKEHKHTCDCGESETAGHSWDDGEITTPPTETTEGVKTYTCTICPATKTETVPVVSVANIFFVENHEGNPLRFSWNESTLAAEHGYKLKFDNYNMTVGTGRTVTGLAPVLASEDLQSGKLSMAIYTGPDFNNLTPIYPSTDVANITISDSTPSFSIKKDESGNYNFVSDLTGGMWVYELYNGKNYYYVNNEIDGAIDSYASFADGHTVKARYVTWTLNDSKTYAEINVTKQAEYTYKENAEEGVQITLVQDGDKYKATWTGADAPNYYFMFADEQGNLSGGWWVDGACETNILTFVPRVDTSCKYSFVLYAATEDYIKGEELARLENCFDITVSGDAMQYEMAFNNPEDGEHTITLGTAIPANTYHLGTWYRNNKIRSMDAGKASYETAVGSTFTRNKSSLQDGDIYDLRLLTSYTLDGQTVKATMTPSSKKTYTAPATDTNAHLMMDGDYLYLVFEDEAGLGSDEWYYVIQNGENITSDSVKEIELTWLLPGIDENTILNYEIQKGTWQSKETFVKLDNAVNITMTDSAPSLSLVPQADGTYKITGGGDTGYFYRVTTPEGERLATDYTIDDTFLCAIYEGCTVELQTGTITVAADGLSANITMSPVVKIENPTLPTGLNTVVEVDTAEELLDAVNRGAIAKLTADITSLDVFKFKTGAPATIDLNGHTLTAPNIRAYYGKELTIDATKNGSTVNSQLQTNLKGSLTLNGGTYDKIRLSGGKKFIANGITAQSSRAYNTVEIGVLDYVEISDSSCISTSSADLTSGLYIWECDEVNLNNVTASAVSNWFGADIAWCKNVNITGGSFSATNNDGLRFVSCEKAVIDDARVSGETTALLVQDGAVVEINDGTFVSTGNNTIQLSRVDSALTINGGTFSVNGDGSVKNIAIMDNGTSLAINGGTFESFTGVTYKEDAMPVINGGTFSFDPTEYVDTTTYIVIDNLNGTFTVAKKTE